MKDKKNSIYGKDRAESIEQCTLAARLIFREDFRTEGLSFLPLA